MALSRTTYLIFEDADLMKTALGLLKKFNDVKTLPHVAIRLSHLIADENSPIKEFEKIIKMDPTLVVRLLRLVNSPYYGLQQKVESISRAVILLGMKNLRNMVVVQALKDIFKVSSEDHIFSRRKLWLHCAAVSICSQMISERIFQEKGEDAFLCGILHDIGIIVEDQVAHGQFIQCCNSYLSKSTPFVEHEREFIGTDHCTVGYLLAKEWKLSGEVKDAIKHHHKATDNISESSISGILQIAEYIVTKLDYPAVNGMQGQLAPVLFEHVRDNLMEYKSLANDLPKEMAKAKEIYDNEPE
jgi:putative nucleotidyltransferase with HDIG domain